MNCKVQTVAISMLAFFALASGCASVAPPNTKTLEERADVLYGQVEFELRLNEIILLNPYLDMESPRVDEFDAARLDLVAAAELLVGYSIDVIEAAQIPSDTESVATVVMLIRDLYSNLGELPFIEPQLTGVDVEKALADAAQQPNMTRALRVAVPVADLIGRAMRASIGEANDMFDLAFGETYDKIIEENRLFMTLADRLVLRRNDVLGQLLLIDDARQGDASAWRELLDGDEDLRAAMDRSPEMSGASIDRAQSMILARLATIMETWDYLEPTWTGYQETLTELYAVEADVRNILKIAKFIIDDWNKAQREMAKGRPAAFIRATKGLSYFVLRRAVRL